MSRTSKTTACRSGRGHRAQATKARTTPRPRTTALAPNRKCPHVATVRNGRTCPVRPNRPRSQTDGLPELPVKTIAYNMWDQAEKTTEKFGSGEHKVERTKKTTYDSAGRPLTTEETSSPATDKSLPKVTDEYNSETGALEKQSTTRRRRPPASTTRSASSSNTKTPKATSQNTPTKKAATHGYWNSAKARAKKARANRPTPTTPRLALMEKLVDSAAGTFTASYDLEGKMTSEIYPNGMCANTATIRPAWRPASST